MDSCVLIGRSNVGEESHIPFKLPV